MPKGVDRFHGVSAQNKSTLIQYEDDLGSTDLSPITVENYSKFILKFGRYLGKRKFITVNADDIKSFLNDVDYSTYSKEVLKMGLIKFYRWLHHTKKGAPNPECVSEIEFVRSKVLEKQRKAEFLKNGKQHLITRDEYEKLIQACEGDIEYQGIIETFFWYGCRISELLSMPLSGVTTNEVGVQITILQSKTEPREVTLPQSEYYPKYLMEWVAKHPLKGDGNAPVWVNMRRTNRYLKVLNDGTVQVELSRIAKRAQIGKHVHPHMFRHSALTRDAGNGLPWTHIASKFGLTKDSRQQRTYDQNKHKEYLEYCKKQPNYQKPASYDELKVQKQKLEEQYAKRFADLETRMEQMNKLIDTEILNGYQKIQQQRYDKQRLEEQEQAQKDLEDYRRGIL